MRGEFRGRSEEDSALTARGTEAKEAHAQYAGHNSAFVHHRWSLAQ